MVIPDSVYRLAEEFYLADEFPQLGEWPQPWPDLFFNPHKDRRDRYRLFVFFWLNGMPAHRCVYWVMWHRTYDRAAWRSIMDVVRDTETDSGRARLQMNRVYNFNDGRVS